ncbi:MAG TPA: DUF5691 domain-containing protein [Ktedonobacteraceae bacterium]|nr:DUF5691 domain-containing protein [Ktedonobacteraceae bacterium]
MDTLVNTAIIGTGQVPTTSLVSELPAATLAEQLATEDPEHQLLLAAGILGIYRRAGYTPAFFPEQPVIAEPEERRHCPETIEHELKSLLKETPGPILLEALQLMQQAHLLFPAKLLPLALNIGRSYQEHRALAYPLLGKRGLWLSQFQTEWAWVGHYAQQQEAILTADAERFWQEGTLEQRQEILLRQRELAPETARNWLASSWRQESVEARKALLVTFAQHLSLDDEEFLEQALDDRSTEVQKNAAELLAQLLTSAFSQRMQARAEQLLSYQDEHIQISIPETVDAHWKHDGLKGNTKSDLQNGHDWIIQIIRQVPPIFWEQRFDRTPEQLIAALGNQEEARLVSLGWCEAAGHFGSSNWYLPLWHKYHRLEGTELSTPWERSFLISLLTQANQQESEALVTYSIEYGQSWEDFLQALPAPWSQTFSDFFLQKLAEHLEETPLPNYYQDVWYSVLLEAASSIAPESFMLALEICHNWTQKGSNAHYYWNQQIKLFRDTIHTRKKIREGIQA